VQIDEIVLPQRPLELRPNSGKFSEISKSSYDNLWSSLSRKSYEDFYRANKVKVGLFEDLSHLALLQSGNHIIFGSHTRRIDQRTFERLDIVGNLKIRTTKLASIPQLDCSTYYEQYIDF